MEESRQPELTVRPQPEDRSLGANLTQQAVAAAAGVKHTYVSKVENGQANLTLDVAARLAAAVGMKVTDLIQGV